MGLRRLPQALARVRYGSLRQFEMKISEAGPNYMRPNPIHLRAAINLLVEAGEVRTEPGPQPRGLPRLPTFYFPKDFEVGRAGDAERRAEVLALYETFMRANHEDGGKTLERAVSAAALRAQAEGRYLLVVGSPDRPPGQRLALNGVEIEQALDLILVSRDGLVAVEDKNEREWLGPKSLEVWELIGKALRLNALPVLICRKVTYDLFLMFKQIGALAFQTHGQRFPEDFGVRLARVQHRDGLGFADIRYGAEPSPGLLRFLGVTLPGLLSDRLVLFREKKALLEEYAFNRLEEDLVGPQRNRLYAEFYQRLKRGNGDDEGEEEDGSDS